MLLGVCQVLRFRNGPDVCNCGTHARLLHQPTGKGRADYHTLSLDAGTEEDCAWSYPSCKAGAKNVEGYWAFYTGSNGITVKRK